MRRVAYGCSKLLYFWLTETGGRDFEFVVDRGWKGDDFHGLPVVRPDEFAKMAAPDMRVDVFAVSNKALGEILAFLGGLGFSLGSNAFLYADLFKKPFVAEMEKGLGWTPDPKLLRFATAFTLNSRKPVHTTICGSWLFLETLKRVGALGGDVAEVGAFEGGNVLCALQSPVWPEGRDYFVMDSFEGFPDLSAADPASFRRGDYRTEHALGEILAPFSVYPQAKVVKGFVPQTFALLPERGAYSLVFYDCDLYQPALDTYAYFWDRMVSGGVILAHDYFAEPGGFGGVKTATDAFFADKDCRRAYFWQNTMAAFVKP